MEEWKKVVGYDEYEVSSYGRVRSIDRIITDSWDRTYFIPGKILTPQIDVNKYGYKQVFVTLSHRHILHRVLIHRLVAEAFIPNPDNLPQVNHKDEDSANNHVENLEWCTCLYNINYGTTIQRRSKNRRRAIDVFDENHNYIETVDSGVVASEKYHASRGHISQGCHNGRKVKNYYFQFSES